MDNKLALKLNDRNYFKGKIVSIIGELWDREIILYRRFDTDLCTTYETIGLPISVNLWLGKNNDYYMMTTTLICYTSVISSVKIADYSSAFNRTLADIDDQLFVDESMNGYPVYQLVESIRNVGWMGVKYSWRGFSAEASYNNITIYNNYDDEIYKHKIVARRPGNIIAENTYYIREDLDQLLRVLKNNYRADLMRGTI
jgi:hypothetical protein